MSKGYRKASVQRLIAACRLLLSPDAPERDDPFGTDFTQDDDALAQMRGALDELEAQVPHNGRSDTGRPAMSDPTTTGAFPCAHCFCQHNTGGQRVCCRCGSFERVYGDGIGTWAAPAAALVERAKPSSGKEHGTQQAIEASASSPAEGAPEDPTSASGRTYGQSAIQTARGDVARAEEARGVNPPCMLCGGPHPFDTSLPSVRWNAVIRANHYPDYMCLTCIVKAFALANESFTAQLFGGFLNGMPIEVRVNGRAATDAIPLNEENNQLRCKVRELEAAVAVQAQEPLEQLIASWRESANEFENRKDEAIARNFSPGVDINRAKMLAYRICADDLAAALRSLRSDREREAEQP